MKKLILILLLVASLSNAQSYLGYLNDNYAGVHGVINNPSSIVDSRFKTDINLFSVSALGGNDYYGVDIFKAINQNYDLEKDAKFFPSANNNFVANIDVLGPSFMINLAPRHSIAIFTRARGIAHATHSPHSTRPNDREASRAPSRRRRVGLPGPERTPVRWQQA